ncbi:hypothetical protein ACPB8Q_05085 [Methanocaldococcus indicus]|uniref:hypothetical protein n=1 Tax=Methanocaldococcus indicus TaxID=213231 RepID=UPI003C6D4A68
MNFNINGYTMMRDKLVLSKRGWKKISEKTGLPNLSSYKDIERYLTSQGISAEHKSVRIVDKIIRLIVIEGDFLEDFEIDMDIEEYINMQGGEVPKDELIKIFGEYVVNKALKDGRIYEPKAGYCRVL